MCAECTVPRWRTDAADCPTCGALSRHSLGVPSHRFANPSFQQTMVAPYLKFSQSQLASSHPSSSDGCRRAQTGCSWVQAAPNLLDCDSKFDARIADLGRNQFASRCDNSVHSRKPAELRVASCSRGRQLSIALRDGKIRGTGSDLHLLQVSTGQGADSTRPKSHSMMSMCTEYSAEILRCDEGRR